MARSSSGTAEPARIKKLKELQKHFDPYVSNWNFFEVMVVYLNVTTWVNLFIINHILEAAIFTIRF